MSQIKKTPNRNSMKEVGRIIVNKEPSRYRRKIHISKEDEESSELLKKDKLFKFSNRNFKSNRTDQTVFIKQSSEPENKSVIKFNENRRRLESIKEAAKHMKSNDNRMHSKREINFNKSQRTTKTPSFPTTKEEKDSDRFQYYKTNSSLSTATGGRIYYSAWKEAFHNKRALNSKRTKDDEAKEENTKNYNERMGNFEMIFPFNSLTERLAIDACKTQNIMNPSKPNHIRLIVNEIKKIVCSRNEEIASKKAK